MEPKRIFRSQQNRVLGGVATGLAVYFNVDVTIVRLIFVLFSFTPINGFVLYILMWLLIPTESDIQQNVAYEQSVRNNAQDIKQTFERIVENLGKLAK
jgi:phage shock protein PspC (stress-responsive transcriptional regulator)